MLRPRVIPSLLIDNGDLIKTIAFSESNYVGDPINAVRIFNEKKCDELVVFDITCRKLKFDPNFDLIKKIAEEARMPVCYGGGIVSRDQAIKIFDFGIEKISVNNLFLSDESLVYKIIKEVGSQSIVLTIDIKSDGKNYFVYDYLKKKSVFDFDINFIKKIENFEFGEIVINNADRDGTMKGFDLDLIDFFYQNSSIPFSILGGAGSVNDLENVAKRYINLGIVCGSFFIYKGPRKAVLINYTNPFKR